MTQDKVKQEKEKKKDAPQEEDLKQEDLKQEDAISDFVDECQGESTGENLLDQEEPNSEKEEKKDDQDADKQEKTDDQDKEQKQAEPEKQTKPEKETTPEKESKQETAPPDNPFMQLEEMRKDYSGFTKDKINDPTEAYDEALKTSADKGVEVASGLAGDVGELFGNKELGEKIGSAITGSYSLIKAIIAKVKDSKDKDEDQIAEDKSKWQKFKELVSTHKDKIFALGEKIISKVPILRSILSAVKMVYKMVQFFAINATRKRMVENRRKFKDKYKDKDEKGEKYVEKSSGVMSWIKRKTGFKKTDETVNKDLLVKKYKGASGTRDTLDKSEKKDIRQYLIDDKLMKLNKERQIKKGKDAALDGLDTTINIMKDVSLFASMGASEAGTAALDAATEGISTGKELAEKVIGYAEGAMAPEKMKEAVDYTGMLLEHVGGMTPFTTDVETIEEFDHVDSDIDATGVDKQELYKNNGKKKEQKKLLIEALAE